jgi:hypothetical protein
MKSVKSLSAAFASSIACAALLLWTPAGFAQPQKQSGRVDKMSSAGKRASRAAINKIAGRARRPRHRTALAVTEDDEDRASTAGLKAKRRRRGAPAVRQSLHRASGGQHVVCNDTRGFSEEPITLSGVVLQDGGKTPSM